ncbi:MAG: hypothetical protein ACUVXA_19390 [Candidatus Jordarchaeum sp.]
MGKFRTTVPVASTSFRLGDVNICTSTFRAMYPLPRISANVLSISSMVT